MSNATDTAGTPPAANAEGTPPVGSDAAGAGQPPADGAGAEGQPAAGGDGTPASGTPGLGDAPTQDPPEGVGTPPAEGAADDDAPTGAPEQYEDFTLPEGVPEGMVLDPEATNAFKEAAKADNLSQAQAQRYVDMAAGLVQKTLDGFQQQHTERTVQWAEQARVDPVVGGPRYDENVQVALAAVTAFGDAELTQAFKEYGLGNHPAFVRAFYRIGKAMNESGFVHGQGQEQPAQPVNAEQRLAARMEAEQARNRGK